MSTFSREHLGSVKVSSGKLVIVDPRNLEGDLGRLDREAERAAADVGGGGTIWDASALAFGTPFRDGEYQVFGTYNDKGELAGVEIQLSE